jgi:hypothetical protein
VAGTGSYMFDQLGPRTHRVLYTGLTPKAAEIEGLLLTPANLSEWRAALVTSAYDPAQPRVENS